MHSSAAQHDVQHRSDTREQQQRADRFTRQGKQLHERCNEIVPASRAHITSCSTAAPGHPPLQAAAAQPTIVYVRPEDEYMHQRCAWSFTFPVENRPVAKDELKPMRLVMLVSAQALQQAK
jgi:hypothetical protein